MENQSVKSSEKDVVNSEPSLNKKIPKIFLIISYFALFLSLPIYGMTVSAVNSSEKLFFCFIGSGLFSLFLFFGYTANYLYFY